MITYFFAVVIAVGRVLDVEAEVLHLLVRVAVPPALAEAFVEVGVEVAFLKG